MEEGILVKDFKMWKWLTWQCDICWTTIEQWKKIYGNTFKEQYNFMVCEWCYKNEHKLKDMAVAIKEKLHKPKFDLL